MSKITMDNFAVMSVQYVHYSLELSLIHIYRSWASDCPL